VWEDLSNRNDHADHQDVAWQEEVERMVGKYKQQGVHGKVYGLDGKAVRGMRKKDDEDWREYMLSVYDVEQRRCWDRWRWEAKKMRSAKPHWGCNAYPKSTVGTDCEARR
jgi:hypothetical protein